MDEELPDGAPCQQREISQKLFRWAMLNADNVPNDSVLARHLFDCPTCQRSVLEWRDQGRAVARTAAAREIVAQGQQAGSRILRRRLDQGFAYFRKRDSDSPEGTLVVLDSDSEIIRIEESSIDTFDRLF